MRLQDQVIVLNTVPYSDSKIIVNGISAAKGRAAFLYYKPKTKRKAGQVYLHPLAVLDVSYQDSDKKTIHALSGVSHSEIFQQILSHHVKRSMAMFLSELLSSVLHAGVHDLDLFRFLTNAVEQLENQNQGVKWFHLKFMLELAGFSGFFPELEKSPEGFLNLATGEVEGVEGSTHANKSETQLIYQLQHVTFDNLGQLSASMEDLRSLLKKLLVFYRLHYPDFRTPESIDIFHAL